MNFYKIISSDSLREDSLVATTGSIFPVEEDDLFLCRKIVNWNDNSWVAGDKGEADSSLQSYMKVMIYSEQLVKALIDGGVTGIQYLPVSVLNMSSDSSIKYFVINVLTSVSDVMDSSLSDFDVYPDNYPIKARVGKIRSLRRLVAKRSMLPTVDAFRMAEYIYPVYVSARFKMIFESAAATGNSFLEIACSK